MNKSQIKKYDSISSIDDMELYLTEIQRNASNSISCAINAQLQVIKFVSTANLIDSTFDLILHNIKKSVSYAKSKKEEDDIREQGALIIQNYVFFSKAKLQYAINKNEKEAVELYKEATIQLVQTSIKIAAIASGNPAPILETSHQIALNILNSNKEKTGTFIGRLIEWIHKEQENEKRTNDFYLSLHNLINKLDRRFYIIGKSNLIAGLIQNYALDLTDYSLRSHFEHVEKLEKEKRKFQNKARRTIKLSIPVTILLTFFTSILSLIASGISRATGILLGDGWVIKTFIFCIGITVLLFINFFIKKLICQHKLKKSTRELNELRESIYQSYLDISEKFEEF